MLYTENIPAFVTLIENYIAKESVKMLSQDDTEVVEEGIFILGVGALVLQRSGLTKEEMDIVITYLLEAYELSCSVVSMLANELPVYGSTGTGTITIPIPVSNIDQTQLTNFILETASAPYIVYGGSPNVMDFNPLVRFIR